MNRRKLTDGYFNSLVTSPTGKRVLKYTLLPSLKHLSAVSIAAELWTRADIQKEMLMKFSSYKLCPDSFNSSRCEWEAYSRIENKVLQQAAKITSIQTEGLLEWIFDIINSMGQEVVKWLDYHDRYVFNMQRFSQTKSIAVECLDCLTWSTTGRVDYVQTVRTMFRKNKILDKWKYRVACIYCLEDEIQTFASILSPSFLNSSIIDNSFLIHFWNSKFTGNSEHIVRTIQVHENEFEIERNVHELVLYYSSNNRNKAGVKYIWNKLNEAEKSQNIKTAIQNSQDVNIVCFLLSQLDVEVQQYVLLDCHQKVLKLLLGDWLWIEFFLPTLTEVWDMVSGSDFFQLLYTVAGKLKTSIKECSQYRDYRYIFRKMWEHSPGHLKTYVFECVDDRPRIVSILCLLSLSDHMGLVRFMLSHARGDIKKRIVFSKELMDECIRLLKNKTWNLLDEMIVLTLEHKDDIIKFKKELLDKDSCCAAMYFLEKEEMVNLEKFLNWIFDSEEEIDAFKRNCLACSEYFSELLAKTASSEIADFEALDNFLTWCFKTDEQLQLFKSSDFMKDNLSQIISNLVKLDNLRLAEQFLKWNFKHQNTVDHYKEVFVSRNGSLLAYLLLRGGVQLLENVLSWCFNNVEDLQLFKRNLLEFQHGTVECILEELLPDLTELVDELLNWCSTSPERINAFKNELMMRDFGYDIISDCSHWDKIIPWFNPSIETARNIRLLHRNITEAFFESMDKFIGNRQ